MSTSVSEASSGPTPSGPTTKKTSSSAEKSCATWYAVQGGNDLYWRVEAPARLIGAKTAILPEIDRIDAHGNFVGERGATYSLMNPNTDSTFPWVETDEGADYPAHEGAAVFTRPDLARATHAKAMRQLHGIRTVAEFDDNYLSNPKFNLFMSSNGFDDVARLDHMKSTASMDGVIVTTDWLRDEYHRAFKKAFGAAPPIYVCGNHVELDRLPDATPSEDGRLRVGFMGSDQHIADLHIAEPALRWASEAGCKVTIIGVKPKWTHFDYSWIPWQAPDKFRRWALPLDIGLCPLLYNKHTLGKSDIKAIEYLISGAAPICQNMPVYKTVRHGETGLLAGSPAEFLHWTRELVTNQRLRDGIVEAGQQWVREERDIRLFEKDWREAVCG